MNGVRASRNVVRAGIDRRGESHDTIRLSKTDRQGKAEKGGANVEKQEKEKQEEKAKKKADRKRYAIFGNYLFLYREMFRYRKRSLLWNGITVAAMLGCGYLTAFISRWMVMLIEEGASPWRMILVLSGAVAAYETLDLLAQVSWRQAHILCLRMRHYFQKNILDKLGRTAYANLEDPEYKRMVDRAKELCYHWNRDVCVCVRQSRSFLQCLLQLLISSAILSALHPLLVAALAVSAWLQYRIGKWKAEWSRNYRENWQGLDMKLSYIVDRSGDFPYAKEMRLYEAENWLSGKYKTFMRQRRVWKNREIVVGSAAEGFGRLAYFAGQAAVYLVLLAGVIRGSVTGADFVFFISLALQLSGSMSQIADYLRTLRESVVSIADYRIMMELPDSRARELSGGREPALSGAPGITFSHLSFSYPGTEKAILEDIDFSIRPGERIALVGLNGAGKTTLIKLLCGLYDPTDGEIRFDGHNAMRWSMDAYYRLFSVVFQDLNLMPATIAENVAGVDGEELDRERVKDCLKQAGLWERVEKLEYGMDTYLKKEVFKNAVNLSGGETQKLLLARAIYKKAPVLILDEPTAALDAIAEQQLYERYGRLTKNRTSIFISHRLASTRFCDRIVMLKDGRIAEIGSHEELMEKKGVYYELYQVQSHYYQEDRKEMFSSSLGPEWEVSGYVEE